MKEESPRFTLDEVCTLADLPRRTVRYYMQHGLVNRPEGTGRGAHYTRRHVEQLLTVKQWKGAGLSLERIRELMDGAESPVPLPAVKPGQVAVWSRVHLAEGVEVHIEPKRAGLEPAQVRALVRAIMAVYEKVQQEEEHAS